ncbi:MAG: hypothetical protein K8Q99_06160 [Acholeplasmataceae bacterium]|nr:hypothetical protein [Acholeplasmataceae bacterium]
MKNHLYLKISLYTLGIIIIALGINVVYSSTLGAGAWDAVAKNLSDGTKITIGTASFIVNVSVLAVVSLYRREKKYLSILIPIIGIALAVDFWNIVVFKGRLLTAVEFQLIFYVFGAILLTFGLAIMVISTYPAMVYEELTLMGMKIFKIKKFFTMRILIELFAIALATLIGYIAQIGFGAVNLGSFILAIAVGPMISIHLKYLSKLFKFLK